MRHACEAAENERLQPTIWRDLGWLTDKGRIYCFSIPIDDRRDCITIVEKRNPLHFDVACGLHETVLDLLQIGDKDMWLEVDKSSGLQPLDLAVHLGHDKFVSVLLDSIRKNRARGLKRWKFGLTICLAASRRRRNILRELC